MLHLLISDFGRFFKKMGILLSGCQIVKNKWGFLIASATLCDGKALKIIYHIYGLAGFVIEGNYRE